MIWFRTFQAFRPASITASKLRIQMPNRSSCLEMQMGDSGQSNNKIKQALKKKENSIKFILSKIVYGYFKELKGGFNAII